MILGVLEPSSGTILIEGRNVMTHLPRGAGLHQFCRRVCVPLQGNLLPFIRTCRSSACSMGVDELGRRLEALIQEFDLVKFRNTKCGVLSSGEQTRASGLAQAPCSTGSRGCSLLDEPTASLDPSTAGKDIRAKICRLGGARPLRRPLDVPQHAGGSGRLRPRSLSLPRKNPFRRRS